MIVYKCKMCGGNLNIREGEKTAVCEYCGTQQTVPSTDDEKRANLFNRANHYRQNCEFDKALAIYEHILDEDSNDAETYWSIVLCRYGIEYVEDPATKERKPTINRMQAQPIQQDTDYQMALEHADYTQKNLYEKEAAEIDRIQKEILRIAQKEEPYDIFISYKEKTPNGERTKSSVLAQDVYNHLTKDGYRVFFSRISLEDKLGQKYEPYIYSALNSSKVMLVIGTERDEFMAPWVKNEWSRFLTMMRENSEKLLIPCFRDITIDELPDEFQILQSQDMGRIGFEQDLLRGIEKVVRQAKTANNMVTSNAVYDNTQSLERLLHNAETYMRLCDYRTALDVYQNITKLYPEDYRGWWGLIRANTGDFTIKKDDCKNDIVKWFGYVRELADDDFYKEKLKDYLETMKKYDSEKWINDELRNVDEIIKKYNQNIGEQSAQIDQLYRTERYIRRKYEKEAEARKEEYQYQKGLAELSQERQRKSRKILAILAVLLLVSLVGGNIVAHYTFLGRIIQICGVVTVIYLMLIRKSNEKSRFQISMDSQKQIMEKPVCISEQDQKQLDILEKKMQQCNEIIKEYKNKISECNLYKQTDKEQLTEVLFALECSKYGIQKDVPNELKELRKKVIGA